MHWKIPWNQLNWKICCEIITRNISEHFDFLHCYGKKHSQKKPRILAKERWDKFLGKNVENFNIFLMLDITYVLNVLDNVFALGLEVE